MKMGKIKKQKKVEWNPNLPLSMLPEEIRESFTKEAEFLYDDLLNNKQEVILIPAPHPYEERNKIRYVDSTPPEWFSRLYYTLGKSRKRALEALLRIANQKDGEFKKHRYKTDTTLRDFIFGRLNHGYTHFERTIPPNKRIKKYFIVR